MSKRGAKPAVPQAEAVVAHSPRPLVLAVALGVVAAALYLPTLRADFVYDDVAQLVIDDYVHAPRHLGDVLTLRVLAEDVLDRNRPLVLLSLMLDSALWGRRPAGYHLTNVALHAGCTVLVFALFLELRRRSRAPATGGAASAPALGGAALGALLFAVHPVASEAVAVITFREDLLATFFLLLGLVLALGRPASGSRPAWPAALSFVLAVAAKETGAAGPPLLLLAWWACARGRDDRPWRALLVAVWIAVGAFLVSSLVFAPAESAVLPPPEPLAASIWQRLAVAARLVPFYLGQIVWPVGLCADYAGRPLGALDPRVAAVGLAAGLVLPVLLAFVDPVARFGLALFWLSLLPVSNLVPLYNPVADRYLYTPMAGLALTVGSLGALPLWWQPRWRRACATVLALVLCVGLAALTLGRERVWHDSRSLWSDTLARNPSSITAATGLALALHDAGDPRGAVELWQRAIATTERLDLEFARPWAGLALSLEAGGRSAEAERAYRNAIAIDERYREPRSLVRALLWRPERAADLDTIARRVTTRPSSAR